MESFVDRGLLQQLTTSAPEATADSITNSQSQDIAMESSVPPPAGDGADFNQPSVERYQDPDQNELQQQQQQQQEEEEEAEPQQRQQQDEEAEPRAATTPAREQLFEAAAGWPSLEGREFERRTDRLHIGAVAGVAVGATYRDRSEVRSARIHRPPMAGIFGDDQLGAESVVLSGGYEDDVDNGETVIYTGAGGMSEGVQVKDQVLQGVNLALARSAQLNRPVRVVRGFKLPSPYAPLTGYRYDGLYKVAAYWLEANPKTKLKIVRFRLARIPGQPDLPAPRSGHAKKASPYKWKAAPKREKRKAPDSEAPEKSSSDQHDVGEELQAIEVRSLSAKERDEYRFNLWNRALLPEESWNSRLEQGTCFICEKAFKHAKGADNPALVRHLQEHGTLLWEQVLGPEERESINHALAAHEKSLRSALDTLETSLNSRTDVDALDWLKRYGLD